MVSLTAGACGVLLLSGGLDSTALAHMLRPPLCVVVDYGQRCARAETRAATAVCRALDLRLLSVRIDLGPCRAPRVPSGGPFATSCW